MWTVFNLKRVWKLQTTAITHHLIAFALFQLDKQIEKSEEKKDSTQMELIDAKYTVKIV